MILKTSKNRYVGIQFTSEIMFQLTKVGYIGRQYLWKIYLNKKYKISKNTYPCNGFAMFSKISIGSRFFTVFDIWKKTSKTSRGVVAICVEMMKKTIFHINNEDPSRRFWCCLQRCAKHYVLRSIRILTMPFKMNGKYRCEIKVFFPKWQKTSFWPRFL